MPRTIKINQLTTTENPPVVAIVGGGIVGLASAYYLAGCGANVTVFEQGSIGTGSTSLAAGGIRTQFNRAADIRMMIESVAVWKAFEETFDTDIRYRQAGYLMCMQDSDQVNDMQDVLALQQELGLNNRLLEPSEAAEYCPRLRHEQFEAVTYGPTDGYADPHSALMGFKQAAERAGATIETGCAVTGLKQYATGRVIGVETDEGCHRVDAVVNAAGAWAPELAACAGLSLPIEPKARRAATVVPEYCPQNDIPLVVEFDSGVYFRPLDDEQMLVGGHFDDTDPTVDPAPNPTKTASLDWQWEALESAAGCASYFGPDAEIVDTWEGRYGMTPDENPIIEESLPGLYTAAGFSGHGMMMAPATGQLVADLVIKGDSSLTNVSAYSSDRFDEDSDASTDDNNEAISQF